MFKANKFKSKIEKHCSFNLSVQSVTGFFRNFRLLGNRKWFFVFFSCFIFHSRFPEEPADQPGIGAAAAVCAALPGPLFWAAAGLRAGRHHHGGSHRPPTQGLSSSVCWAVELTVIYVIISTLRCFMKLFFSSWLLELSTHHAWKVKSSPSIPFNTWIWYPLEFSVNEIQ